MQYVSVPIYQYTLTKQRNNGNVGDLTWELKLTTSRTLVGQFCQLSHTHRKKHHTITIVLI